MKIFYIKDKQHFTDKFFQYKTDKNCNVYYRTKNLLKLSQQINLKI